MAREYRYLLVDVFTETPLAGNQLAVFVDADGLTDAEMQALARETNLSETTFCLPRESKVGDLLTDGVRVRIFTTEEELKFAGHPTLGTATVLRWVLHELRGATAVKLQLQVGVVPVRFAGFGDAAEPGAAEPMEAEGLPFGRVVRGEMEQPRPWFGQRHDRVKVAQALGLPVEAIDGERPIQTVSTGMAFVVVPLVSEEALNALAVPQQAAQRYLDGVDGKFFYLIAPGASATEWHARMQFYGGEDPATGSAAGCATAYLVAHGYVPARTRFTIRQGVAMGRPSTIFCEGAQSAGEHSAHGRAANGQVWDETGYVRVGGSTVLVAEGRFFLA